ncbi:glycosyl hydrolase [Galbibacter sp. PAP.153]|uniref:glycosyl hydrolase n=1 Tax=Galbibacter sp. PAP.153 TaxID=3104623 RepID=UPI0030086D22
MKTTVQLFLMCICGIVNTQGQTADKPLYRDPVHDGAADPTVIWNEQANKWYMFYTNRRANVDSLDTISWVHGTQIGIAESSNGGASWKYKGICNIDYRPTEEYSYWAPDVIENKGIYHMYLTYVPGIFSDWYHPRKIIHLTSTDLLSWKFESELKLASERCIDADVIRLPNGKWRLFYNNENDGKSIYYTDSDDLYHWPNKSKKAAKDRGEGPVTFKWKGKFWMICDSWDGLSVYSSTDLATWNKQAHNILKEPGKGIDDKVKGGHPDVVISNDKAYVFYFTHPGRVPSSKGIDTYETRRSSIQVAELYYNVEDQSIGCDRNKKASISLIPN